MDAYVYINEQGDPQATGNDFVGWGSQYYDRVEIAVYGLNSPGQLWSFANLEWYYSISSLRGLVKSHRNNLMNSGTVIYESVEYPATQSFLVNLLPLSERARIEPAGNKQFIINSQDESLSVTNAYIIGLVDEIIRHRQGILSGEQDCYTAIDSEAITTPAEIEAQFDSSILAEQLASPISHSDLLNRDNHNGQQAASTISDFSSAVQAVVVGVAPETLDTLQEISAALGDDENFSSTMTTLIEGKQDSIVAGAHIGDVADDSPEDATTNYGLLSLLSLGEAINESNEKQNAMANNINVLATSFNELLASLEAQGLLESA